MIMKLISIKIYLNLLLMKIYLIVKDQSLFMFFTIKVVFSKQS